MSPRRSRRFLPLLLIICATLILFRHLTFSDLILARGDTYNYFYPYWDARNAAFRAGELPLWTTDLFMGAPLLANPQLGTYYPLNWLTAPFRAPQAIKISILIHSVLAGLGVFYLYREAVEKRAMPALLAALVYSFSGYLGAHVEQINQYQGLAWLPFLFALYHRTLTRGRTRRDGLLFALAWALQIFCGHTQTVFISGIGLGLYGIGLGIAAREGPRQIGRRLLTLGTCTLAALLLAVPQLLPSLELIGMSNRGSGFSAGEVTAFSLSPNLLGRALLPSYDGQLFGEYVAYLGVIGLGLALWGVAAGHLPAGLRRVWIGLALLGLLLALGRSSPLFLLLAELPLFNLFRVPARFLALFTLGMSILAGMGLSAIERGSASEREQGGRRGLMAVGLIIAALITLTRFLLRPAPGAIFGGEAISNTSLALWGLALLLLLTLLLLRHRWLPYAALALVFAELLLAGRNLPYNDLSPPEVYLSQRFTISQLLAYQAEETVPGRTLSISQIYFDPGDIAALRARYDRLGMDYKSQFHALDAVKKQEMLMPNLALAWGIPTIDGFGGGITPTVFYSQFTSRLLPEDAEPAVDGRLGERMALPECSGACIPELPWLQMTDTRYLIVDKVYDIWLDGIAYDTALADFWQEVERVPWPDDPFDQARILHAEPLPGRDDASLLENGLLLTVVDRAGLESILASDHSMLALTFTYSGNKGIFLQAQPPDFQRVLSSAIKVYRVPSKGGRAYLASQSSILPDSLRGREEALRLIGEGDRDVIHGEAGLEALAVDQPGGVTIVDYDDTRVVLEVDSSGPAYLILRDAFYPGWTAEVNGEPKPILRANVIFRALEMPAGQSRVVFAFEPHLWRAALAGGLLLWGAALLLLLMLMPRGPSGLVGA
ncbi:MAG: YfhO family protein [Chloroflexota bacterium]|nr:YfhO family protein [Chloroflexota bacterium]